MRRTSDRLEEDRMLQDAARRFLEKDHSWTPSGNPPDRNKLAELGWFMMGLPEELGGLGNDLHQSLLVLQEAGRVLLPGDLIADMLLAPLVLQHLGDSALAESLGAGAARFAWAPSARSADGMRRASGNNFIGRSLVCPDLAQAEYVILSLKGLLALAPVAALRQHPVALLDGRNGGQIHLDGPLPQGSRIIAEDAEADDLSARLADLAAIGNAAELLGSFEAGLALTVEYLKTRTQFKQPLASFQAVQQHMANVFAAQEAFRSLCLAAASAPEGAPRHRLACNLAILLRRKLLPAAGLCIQVTGGIGMTEDFMVGHVYRRLQTGTALWLRDGLLDGAIPQHTDPLQKGL